MNLQRIKDCLQRCSPPRSGLRGLLWSHGCYNGIKITREHAEENEQALKDLDQLDKILKENKIL